MKLNKIEAITPDEVKLFNPDSSPNLMVDTINRLLQSLLRGMTKGVKTNN